MDVMYLNFKTGFGFKCADFGYNGELWISENPDPSYPNVPYFNSVAPDVKSFYVFLPDDAMWKSAVPMMSSDGGPGEALTADPARCGWYYKRYIDEAIPSKVIIYRDDDPTQEDAIGLNGIWDEDGIADPIPLATNFTLYSASTLYFVADDFYWDADLETSGGWSATDPTTVESSCTYNLTAIIYDTDASLHGAFTCAPGWTFGQTPAEVAGNACPSAAPYSILGAQPCIGVTPGIVKDLLGADNKPVYNPASGCFDSEEAFDAMFNQTPNVNETYCYDIPISRSKDGQWEFDSDNYQSPGATVPGGFYPAEVTPTTTLISAPLPAAETKRKAEGPVFLCKGFRELDADEQVPKMDVLCKGPGWDREDAIDCSGYFKRGEEFTPALIPYLSVTDGDGWGWSCPSEAPVDWPKYVEGSETPSASTQAAIRWTSGDAADMVSTTLGRNQHFCFESHASFTHKPGLRFSVRGNDDIWVFIGGKLAVDIGGTHLAAPGYVDLDQITDKEGNDLVTGSTYPIDIFFCDRRTTMSNIHISTNMYIQQETGMAYQTGIIYKATKLAEGKAFELCWNESSDASCAAALGGSGDLVELCGQEILDAGKTIDYTLTHRDGSIVSGGDVADLAAPAVYFGGIDLTNRYTPIINVDHMQGLPSDSYKLTITIGNKSTYIIFRVPSNTLSIQEVKSSASTMPSSYKLIIRNNKVELQKETNTRETLYYNLHGSRVK